MLCIWCNIETNIFNPNKPNIHLNVVTYDCTMCLICIILLLKHILSHFIFCKKMCHSTQFLFFLWFYNFFPVIFEWDFWKYQIFDENVKWQIWKITLPRPKQYCILSFYLVCIYLICYTYHLKAKITQTTCNLVWYALILCF